MVKKRERVAMRKPLSTGGILLLSIVALLISAAAFTFAYVQSQPQHLAQQQQMKMDFAAAHLQHLLSIQLKNTAELAKSPLVAQNASQPQARQRIAKQIEQFLPHSQVKLLGTQESQQALSFTERDLLRQLREKESAYTFMAGNPARLITVHKVGSQAYLIVAQAIAPWFQPLTHLLNDQEGFHISDGEGARLWQSGLQTQEAKTTTASGWKITLFSEEAANQFSALYLGYAATGILILGFAVLLFTSRQQPQPATTSNTKPEVTPAKASAPQQSAPPELHEEDIFSDTEPKTSSTFGQGIHGITVDEGEEEAPLAEPVLERPWPEHIFRRNGIVGSTLEEVDDTLFYALGQVIGSAAQEQNQHHIIVARDERQHSDELAIALNDGLQSTGAKVTYLNACPISVLQYASTVLTSQTALYVTGGTGGVEENGLKVILNGKYLNGQELLALCKNANKATLAQGRGSIEHRNLTERYIQAANEDIVLAKPLTLVVDCANAVTGHLANQFFTALGCRVIPLFHQPNGEFPNHLPNPAKAENLRALTQAVETHKADLGIAFNGDGSSFGVVTSSGTIIWPDRLLMLFARDLLTRNPGTDVIYDVECSRELSKLVVRMGGRPTMSQSGNTAIQTHMQEKHAMLGGEFRGHFYFADRWHGYDDGFYAAARLLEILTLDDNNADQIFARIHTGLATPTMEVPVSEGQQYKIIAALKRQSDAFVGATINTLDGVRVEYDDGWGLVRVSQSRPSLMIRFEGQDKAILKDISERFRTELLKIAPTLRLPF